MPATERIAPQSAQTRQRLLAAGVRLFAEHGYRGVSVRELSAAAGANVAAVSYHFGSKRGLYHAIFESALDADEARFREAMDALHALVRQAGGEPARLAAPVQLFVHSLLGRLTGDEHSRGLTVLVIREMAFPSEAFDLIYARRAAPLLGAMLAILAALGEDAASEAARIRAQALTGMVAELAIARAVLWRHLAWDGYTAARVARVSAIVTELVSRAIGIAPAPAPAAPENAHA
ncbi:MAG: CerR family C-terminal domain-containing protein [Gammaproteobacteria bacterium]|nr:CerR family C-terminal domain-containing protein [Gammaproteobacteria bacterium]